MNELDLEIQKELDEQYGLILSDEKIESILYSKSRLLKELLSDEYDIEFKWELIDGTVKWCVGKSEGMITGEWRLTEKDIVNPVNEEMDETTEFIDPEPEEMIIEAVPAILTRFECGICGREFTTKRGLSSHSRVHK